MMKYTTSFRLELRLFSAKKKIAKLEALAGKTTSRRGDLNVHPEFDAWKKVRLLDASCSGSLMKETRLQEEVSLCGDKTRYLDGQFLSFQCKVVDLERAHQSLKFQKLALQEQALKLEQRIAALELALKSWQQQGVVQLKVDIVESESRPRILQSEKESLKRELAKLRLETSKLESQIKNIITRDKTELFGESIKLMKYADKENTQIHCKVNDFVDFPDGETDKTELRRELSERKINDAIGNGEYVSTVGESNSSRSRSGREKLEVRQFSGKSVSSTEISQKNAERIRRVDSNTLQIWEKSRSVEGETRYRESWGKNKKSSELNSETKKDIEKDGHVRSTNTLREFHTSRRVTDGKDHKPEPQCESTISTETKKEFATENQASDNTFREVGKYRPSFGSKHYLEQIRIGNPLPNRSFEVKKDVDKRGQQRASNCRVFITDTNFRDSEEQGDSTPNDCSANLLKQSGGSGDDIYKFQALAEVGSCHYEEGTLEGDLLKLRAKLCILESYINRLIQEKRALLNELSETKETAEKKVLENTKILLFLGNSKNFKEGVTRKEATWKDQFLFESFDGYAGDDVHKLGELATGWGPRPSVFQTDRKHLEEELTRLQANRRNSNLESDLEESIRDKTALLTELCNPKESYPCEKSDHEYALNSPSIKRLETSASYKSCEQASQDGGIFRETCRENSEVRKFRELAADLQTKYTICITELEKQRKLIASVVLREEAATRVAHEDARELQLKLEKSHLDIETRDLMIKTLMEDKRRLERNIQELASYVPQKCLTHSGNDDLEEIRTLFARIRKGRSETNPNLYNPQ